MKAPKVSILIPTYKFAQFLPDAIESVLAQDFQDYELLIVDDCSPDNTAEVVARYLERDPRIHFEVNSVNRGMVANWNYCLSKASGEYIKFLFGDDKFADPQALSKLVAMLESNPAASMAVSARKIINETSDWVDTWDHLGKAGLHKGKATIIRCLIRDQNLIGEPSVVLFRKAQALRGFNLAYRQIVDLEMWFHLLEQGDLVYTREQLCCFRQHSAQQTAVNSVNRVGQAERFLLLDDCSKRSWITAESSVADRLGLVHSLRHVAMTPQIKAMKDNFLIGVSKRAQFLFWVKCKLLRPFENLKRSCQKRAIRLGFAVRSHD